MFGGKIIKKEVLKLTENKPNILMIMTDQQRYDSLGCYGFEAAHTPHLDQLAKEGVLFENNYVPNPICTPSRSSLWTGKHLPGHSVYRLYDNLPKDEVLFSKRLQQIGYQTALFGKLHVSSRIYEASDRHPNDGFDIYEWCMEASIDLDSPFNGYAKWLRKNHPGFYKELKEKGRKLKNIPQEVHLTHWAAARTIDYIKKWDRKKPFFCMMSVFDPHNPYEDYPVEMLKLIDEKKIPDPIFKKGEIINKPEGIKREHEHTYLGSFNSFTIEDLRKMRLGYHVSLAFLDQEVGKVLKALEDKGVVGNTLVIFTSDHGDMLGDHQLLVKGAFFYDPAVKVPLIMRWPDKLKGEKRISQLVQLHDLAATVLSAAGFSSSDLKDIMPESCNLFPLIQGEKKKLHDYVICCYRDSGINDKSEYFDPPIYATMLRDKRFKLNVYHNIGNFVDNLQGELYNMEEDKHEFNNLWNEPAFLEEKNRMMGKLLDWVVSQELNLGSRGGESFPDSSQRLNNKLK